MTSRSKTRRDHTVPQMYLKRWCAGRDARSLCAASADGPASGFPVTRGNVASENNFYFAEGSPGAPDLDLEDLLAAIETAASPAFRRLLDEDDSPTGSALPLRWPPRPVDRYLIAWWVSAQILRTSRQRARLLALRGEPLQPPPGTPRADLHLGYIVENLAPLANIVFRRPWGIGFCSLCLLTSDVPVQLINAQDDPDQPLAVAYWDIYLPLDPHRFLYLPGISHAAEDHLRGDHRINFPATYGIAMNELMIETAHRHVFWHPDHDPRSRMRLDDALSIRRSDGGSQSVLYYDTFRPNEGVERWWLTHHVWDADAEQHGATAPARDAHSEGELRDLLDELAGNLDASRSVYESIREATRSGGAPSDATPPHTTDER